MSGYPKALGAAMLALAAMPAGALAASGDSAATGRYIQADYTLVRSAGAKIPVAEAAMRSLRARMTGECPRAAVASPQDPDSEQLSNELIGAIVLDAYHTDVPAGTSFVRAVRPLRWSSPTLTRAVHAYAAKLNVLTTLAPPDVCEDIGAWVASGYRTLPASTVRFDQQFMPNWVAIGELPSALTPFERSGERSMLHAAAGFESQLTETEANAGVETWEKLMNMLVLQP